MIIRGEESFPSRESIHTVLGVGYLTPGTCRPLLDSSGKLVRSSMVGLDNEHDISEFIRHGSRACGHLQSPSLSREGIISTYSLS